MPGNTEAILYDVNGDPLAVDDGVAIPAGTPLIISGGSDGTNSRYIKVDSSGNQILVGLGIAGTPTGGVITIQGDPAGTPIPISGNITASNASVGLNDTAIPGSSTLIAGSDGTNLRSLRVFDADTGGGTQWILGVGLRKFAGGGSVEFGTSSDPIRTDPTGTTTQPISGTITANQGGSWTVAGTGNFTVVQATASNLRAQLASEAATGTAVPSTAVQMGGSDGVNLRPFFTDSSGRQIVIGAAANGAAVTGNPVLVAGSDGTNARSIRTATDGTVRVDPTGTTTQPVSGTVTTNQGTSPWVENVSQFGGSNVVTGTGTSGAGIPRITVSNDSNILATQSGTWTVQQGTPPWSVVGTAADGAAPSGNPVLIAGQDGTNVQSIATDGYGRPNIYVGQWFGSAAPTVGQKAMVSSIPVTISSDQSTLNVAITTASGTAISIVAKGYLDTNATNYYEYIVPGGQSLTATAFYSGGAPQNSAAGAVRASLIIHDSAVVSFITNGDFESAADVTAWAAVTGAFTAPSPDVSSVQFWTGASSMRWIYTSSATAHERKNTFASPIDITGYRYIKAHFFNDNAAGTTRTISIVLTSGANTRTYSLSGTLGSAPFTANTWIELVADLEAPTTAAGTTFDESVVNSISVRMLDAANKSGTVYWDTVRLEDSLNFKHLIFSADGSSVQVITAPESYPTGTTLYLRTKNTNNTRTEYATVLNGTLQ